MILAEAGTCPITPYHSLSIHERVQARMLPRLSKMSDTQTRLARCSSRCTLVIMREARYVVCERFEILTVSQTLPRQSFPERSSTSETAKAAKPAASSASKYVLISFFEHQQKLNHMKLFFTCYIACRTSSPSLCSSDTSRGASTLQRNRLCRYRTYVFADTFFMLAFFLSRLFTTFSSTFSPCSTGSRTRFIGFTCVLSLNLQAHNAHPFIVHRLIFGNWGTTHPSKAVRQ